MLYIFLIKVKVRTKSLTMTSNGVSYYYMRVGMKILKKNSRQLLWKPLTNNNKKISFSAVIINIIKMIAVVMFITLKVVILATTMIV